MTFWAIFIGLLATESLAMPHHSFLHEVDFPGVGPENSTATEPASDQDAKINQSNSGVSDVVKRDEFLNNQTDDANVAVNVPNTAPNLDSIIRSSDGAGKTRKRDIGSQEIAVEDAEKISEIQNNKTDDSNVPVNDLNIASTQATSSPDFSSIVKRETSTPESKDDGVMSNDKIQSNQTGVPEIVKRHVEEVTENVELNDLESKSNHTDGTNFSENEPKTTQNLEGVFKQDILNNQTSNSNISVNDSETASSSSPDISGATKREIGDHESVLNETEIENNHTDVESTSVSQSGNEINPMEATPASDVVGIVKRSVYVVRRVKAAPDVIKTTPNLTAPIDPRIVKREINYQENADLNVDEIQSSGTDAASISTNEPNTVRDLNSASNISGDDSQNSTETNVSDIEAQNDLSATTQQANTPIQGNDITTKNHDQIKERILRSIIEEASLKVNEGQQSTLKSDKCQCPSGECSGEVCKKMDMTSVVTNVELTSTVPTTTSDRLSRNARSLPNDATTSNDVSTTGLGSANIVSSSTVPTEATQKSNIQTIRPRHSRSIPDVTTSEVDASLLGSKPTVNESEVIKEDKPVGSEQTVVNQSDLNTRKKRDSEDSLDDLELPTEEEKENSGETPQTTPAVDLAPDAPAGFEPPNPVLLERSRRLYRRSVLETEGSSDGDYPASAIHDEESGSADLKSPAPTAAPDTVKESVRVQRHSEGNAELNNSTSEGTAQAVTSSGAAGSGKTQEISATGGAASVSAQVSTASPETPLARSDLATIGIADSRVELPGETLPNSENGEENEENELARTRYVRSAQEGASVDSSITSASSGANEPPIKTTEQNASPDDSTRIPAATTTTGATGNSIENQEGSGSDEARGRRSDAIPLSSTTETSNVSGDASTEGESTKNQEGSDSTVRDRRSANILQNNKTETNSTEIGDGCSKIEIRRRKDTTPKSSTVEPSDISSIPTAAENTENREGTGDIIRDLRQDTDLQNSTTETSDVSDISTEAESTKNQEVKDDNLVRDRRSDNIPQSNVTETSEVSSTSTGVDGAKNQEGNGDDAVRHRRLEEISQSNTTGSSDVSSASEGADGAKNQEGSGGDVVRDHRLEEIQQSNTTKSSDVSSSSGAGGDTAQEGSSNDAVPHQRLNTTISQTETTQNTNISSASTEKDLPILEGRGAKAVNAVNASANVTEIGIHSTESRSNQSNMSATEAKNGNASSDNVESARIVSKPAVKETQHHTAISYRKPSINHRVFMHPSDSKKEMSPREERKIQERQEAAKEQEEMRLGESSGTDDDKEDFGPLDIRTMGGNQLDIDPIDINGEMPRSHQDSSRANVKRMEEKVSSSNQLSPGPLLSLLAVLSSQLKSRIAALLAYLSH